MTEMISVIRPSDSGRMVALLKSNSIFSLILIRFSSTTTRFGFSCTTFGLGGGGGGSPTTDRADASSKIVGPQAASGAVAVSANEATSANFRPEVAGRKFPRWGLRAKIMRGLPIDG
ncbi:hypothetical protein [Nannocystis pusilla]|uniref:hypothetical protein n=1 Tax=Nannocystis pusilla TaxID=889268 RepID=UPI003DA47912